MKYYASEATFSRALVKELRKKGCFVQRIESHETGRGIPDIYSVTIRGVPMWLELKRIKRKIAHSNIITWRPGQQAWLWEVSRRYKQQAYTVVAFDDCYAIIDNSKLYKDNIVKKSEMELYGRLGDMVGGI